MVMIVLMAGKLQQLSRLSVDIDPMLAWCLEGVSSDWRISRLSNVALESNGSPLKGLSKPCELFLFSVASSASGAISALCRHSTNTCWKKEGGGRCVESQGQLSVHLLYLLNKLNILFVS